MNTTPALSVIVPVYNTGNYLRQCLDSILAQTFPNFELIVVNDGNTDNSAHIIEEYRQREPRIIPLAKQMAA